MDAASKDSVTAIRTRDEAQQRADQIKIFTSELARLEEDEVLVIAPDQRARINNYHAETLNRLAQVFDIDTSIAAKQMSWGMRIVSFLGALAISAAVFFFFYRFWGLLSTSAQVAILVAAPVTIMFGAELAARREKTLYFTSLISLVAFTAFVLDLSMLGQIFTITPSQTAFLAWGGFALILAYTYRLRLLLVAGLVCVMGYLAATIGTWCGSYWLSFGERPENFIGTGIFIFVAAFIPARWQHDFAPTYRVFGLLVTLLAVLVLSHWGAGSYLFLPAKRVEQLYQMTGFGLSGLTIWLGIKERWPSVTNLGSTFFVIFLYTKLFDWWWDWLPKYLFFLILGVMALMLLLILKKMRLMVREVAL